MNYNSDFRIQGYGMCVDEVECDKVLAFLNNHHIYDGYSKAVDAMKTMIKTEGGFETSVFAEVVANVMQKETGISFYSADNGMNSYVLFLEQMPWQYTEKERGLGISQLQDIVEKYADELGVKVNKIGYFSVDDDEW